MVHAMNSTIDKAGRIVVPKPIRTAARLEPGTEVSFRLVSGRVEMEPAPLAVSLERRGHLVVAVPNRELPALAVSEFEDTIAAVRNPESDGSESLEGRPTTRSSLRLRSRPAHRPC